MNKVVHATAELFVNVALTSYKDGADYWRRASRLLYSSSGNCLGAENLELLLGGYYATP